MLFGDVTLLADGSFRKMTTSAPEVAVGGQGHAEGALHPAGLLDLVDAHHGDAGMLML